MKRLLVVLCVVGFIFALPLSQSVLAKPNTKVAICHVNSANEILDLGDVVVVFGRVIEVSENAVEAHEAHGDSTAFEPLSLEERHWFEEGFGLDLGNADCYVVLFR